MIIPIWWIWSVVIINIILTIVQLFILVNLRQKLAYYKEMNKLLEEELQKWHGSDKSGLKIHDN